MATGTAPIALSGLASGLDTTSIVNGLVAAESAPMNAMQTQQTTINGAISQLSALGTQFSTLSSAAGALADATSVGSFTASSSSSAIVATASGAAQTGVYQVTVNSLAAEQRTYSASFGSETSALGQSGSFTVKVGSAAAATINVASGDSLDAIAAKINQSGQRVSASVFFDGTNYRLQIRGLDTGAANAITFTESGTTLDLNGTGATASSGKTVQKAADASVTVDGFTATRPTNQLTGVIPGVTLAVTQQTTSPVTIQVASDPSTLNTKVQAVVTAYNQIISSIHADTGYGTTAANNPKLAGDSTLRSIAAKLSTNVQTVFGSGNYSSLATVGITLQKDGTLALDTTKLDAAFTSDPKTVEKLFSGSTTTTGTGAMSSLRDLADSINLSTTGLLAVDSKGLSDQVSRLGQSIASQQAHIDSYKKMLQAEFTQMETAYSQNQSLLNQINQISTKSGG